MTIEQSETGYELYNDEALRAELSLELCNGDNPFEEHAVSPENVRRVNALVTSILLGE